MGVSNRHIGQWMLEGDHKGHLVVSNARTASSVGKRVIEVVTRCFPCQKLVAIQQGTGGFRR